MVQVPKPTGTNPKCTKENFLILTLKGLQGFEGSRPEVHG